ncbi:HNH endonuclease [Streptomyces kanasensis]|uniref:HNH endonuclease n=1 Tax=Streptomyces kanasensis TaxID=936756 RepID=UPI0036F886C1
MQGQDLIKRIGKLKAAQRSAGGTLHRPLLLLWAIAQAVHRRPRQQPWSVVRAAVRPLISSYAGVTDAERGALEAFWDLQGDGLWEVHVPGGRPLSGRGRRPQASALDATDPLAGLPEADYEQVAEDPALAAWAVGTVLHRFFDPIPADLLADLELSRLMAGRLETALRPFVGEPYPNRRAIADVYGGNRVLGITPLADGILTVYSDDKGPYADRRIPETNWIAYTGDGLSGHQKLVSGNASMAAYQEQQKALRYWHKPYGSEWTFETWAVIVQRRRRWGRGEDKRDRREFVWILAPVPSPLRDSWPADVREALAADDGRLHDDTLDFVPPGAALASGTTAVDDHERYRRLSEAARRRAASRTERSKLTTVERYLRSTVARQAVLLRSGGHCENPSCLGHPLERTDTGAPILEVDHVKDLARGGQDTPETMIALCPNCHALKTRGEQRQQLRKVLLNVARQRHLDFAR